MDSRGNEIRPIDNLSTIASTNAVATNQGEAYSCQFMEDLYLTMIKVTDFNRPFWKEYASISWYRDIMPILAKQMRKKTASTLQHPKRKMVKRIASGMLGFFVHPKEIDAEQWVVMASSKRIEDQNNVNLLDIEMTLMVTTHENSSVSVHMGIARTYFSIFSENKHNLIAFAIHAFAAKSMRERYPKKNFMMSAPISFMASAFIKQLGKEVHEVSRGYSENGYTHITFSKDGEQIYTEPLKDWFYEYPNLFYGQSLIYVNLEILSKVQNIPEISYSKFESKTPTKSVDYFLGKLRNLAESQDVDPLGKKPEINYPQTNFTTATEAVKSIICFINTKSKDICFNSHSALCTRKTLLYIAVGAISIAICSYLAKYSARNQDYELNR